MVMAVDYNRFKWAQLVQKLKKSRIIVIKGGNVQKLENRRSFIERDNAKLYATWRAEEVHWAIPSSWVHGEIQENETWMHSQH